MSHTEPCPECGSPVASARNYGTTDSPRWSISWTCGRSHEYDGPGNPCRNAPEPEPTKEPEPTATVEAIAAELEEIETLPAPLTAAQVTERELRRLEAYRGEVLADVTDAKAAKALNEKRLQVWRTRTAAVRICKEQREDAIKTQREWVGVEKKIAGRLEPVEEHLEREIDRHEAWKAEQARIAEEARLARIRARVEALVACGAPVEMAEVEGLEDAEWDDYLAHAQAAAAQKRESEDRARNLTALGDECSPEEASYLTEDQYAHRLLVAQQAQREREERARIEAKEKAEQERKEAQRRAELEAENERLIARMREQEAEVARLRAEADAREAAEAEAKRKEQQEKERAEREAREDEERAEAARKADEARAAEAARQEALRPERERIAAWARNVLDTMPSTPAIQDTDLLRRMRITVEDVRDRLIDLEQEMHSQDQRNAVED